MKRKTVMYITTILLLMSTVICVITGIIKWPGLIMALGLTYRQVPMALITDLHDWSGVLMAVLAAAHMYQFRGLMTRMARTYFKGVNHE